MLPSTCEKGPSTSRIAYSMPFLSRTLWHERGVNDEALAGRLQAMARFRNLLVLRYWQVDDQRVLRIARKEVGNLLEFLRQVGAYLGATLQEARRDSLPC